MEGLLFKNTTHSKVRLLKMRDPCAYSAEKMEDRSRKAGLCARLALTCPPRKSGNQMLFLWQENICKLLLTPMSPMELHQVQKG